MKRLVYAIIIFVFLITLTFYSHFSVKHYCKDTLNDLKNFSNQEISGDKLTSLWNERKEKMSAFVNHDFLDQISLYIGQITLGDSNKDKSFKIAHKNIVTLLNMINAEQRLATHSFY